MPAQSEKEYYTPVARCIGGVIQLNPLNPLDVGSLDGFLNRKVFEDREPMLVSEYLRISKDFWRGEGPRDTLDIIYEWKDELHVVLEYLKAESPARMRINARVLTKALAEVGQLGDHPRLSNVRELFALGGHSLFPKLNVLNAVHYHKGIARGMKPIWRDELENVGFFTGEVRMMVQRKQILSYWFGGNGCAEIELSPSELALIIGSNSQPIRISYPSPDIAESVAESLEKMMGSLG